MTNDEQVSLLAEMVALVRGARQGEFPARGRGEEWRDEYHGQVIHGLEPEQVLVGEEEYDRVILVMYPSPLNPQHQRVSHDRIGAIEIGHLFAFTQRSTEPEGLREQK